MLSKLKINNYIKLILIPMIMSSVLNASSNNLMQDYPDIETNVSASNFPAPMSRIKSYDDDVAEELNLFKVSCDGIKYTGALETVAIKGLETTKEAITKMFMPFLSLSSFEVAIFAAGFLECIVTVSVAEVKGDEVSSSAAETAIDSLGNKGSSKVVLTAGAAVSPTNLGVKTDFDFFPDIAGTFNAFLKTKVNEGWFNNVMMCTMNKRLEIYQKLYEFLNQQFTLKLNFEKMSFSQCNIQLIQEGEEVPSWNAMFGNKINEMTNDFMDNLDSNGIFSKEISINTVCQPTDNSCRTPATSGCIPGKDPNCKPFSTSEVTIETKEIGNNISASSTEDINSMALKYPADKGYNITQNNDGTWKVTQDIAKVGAGTMLKKMPAIQRMQEEWDAEQEKIKAQNEVNDSNQVNAQEKEIKRFRNPYNECKNGISSMGTDDCLTYEQAKDYRKNMVKTSPATKEDFERKMELTQLEKTIFKIMSKNPKGFKETLEFIYDKIKLLNQNITVAVKNTAPGKEELNYIKTFRLNYNNNFKLITTTDNRLIDIEQIELQNEEESKKILVSSEFANALIEKIVMELTGKRIPVNKKIDNQTFENVIKIFYNHRNNYERFIDISYLINNNITALDGSNININIFTDDINTLYDQLEIYFQNQRLAIKKMFENTTTLSPDQGNIPNTNQGSTLGITSMISGLNEKDYRQELVKRANEVILEYKLSGEESKIKSIVFFYKLFLYFNPTSLQDKMEEAETILNNTTFAMDIYKRANLMHGEVLEGILLEKAKNYKIIEKYIDKRD